MTQEHRLERAGADLRAATSSMPLPTLRTRQGLRGGVMAFAAGLAVALIIGIPAYIAQTSAPGGGTAVGASDSTTTTQTPGTTRASAPSTTTPTTSTEVNSSFACGAELPWDVELPDDFTGPDDGPSPHSLRPAEEGQYIVHWLGRDGSVEIRWPVNAEYLEGVEWGAPPVGRTALDIDEFALFLFSDPDPGTFQTVGAAEVLPSDIMEGPCDAAQLNVFASESDAAFSAANAPTFGQSEDADLLIYPNLPRPRDKVLIVETIATSEIPRVIACQGGPEVEDVPPNRTGTTPDGPVFDTPEEALEDLLTTDVADTWPKRGFFELVTPDGTVIYGNPYDDMSPDPRPENGLVISVTVVEADSGWTVTEWETSGC